MVIKRLVQPLNDGGPSYPDLPQKDKLHLRMGGKVRLRRGFHAGRLRSEASPRARLGDFCRMAGDPLSRWSPAGCPHPGGSHSGITVRPHDRTHHTQVMLTIYLMLHTEKYILYLNKYYLFRDFTSLYIRKSITSLS